MFVKNELAIRGTVRINGYVDRDVAVQALFETTPGKPLEVVGATTLRSSHDGEEMPVEFSYVPQTAGERKVTLRVLPMPNEQDTTNNEQSNFVKVLPGGLNVFYVEGELRVEQRFLRRALASSPDIKVDFQWIDHRLRNEMAGRYVGPFSAGQIRCLHHRRFGFDGISAARSCQPAARCRAWGGPDHARRVS